MASFGRAGCGRVSSPELRRSWGKTAARGPGNACAWTLGCLVLLALCQPGQCRSSEGSPLARSSRTPGLERPPACKPACRNGACGFVSSALLRRNVSVCQCSEDWTGPTCSACRPSLGHKCPVPGWHHYVIACILVGSNLTVALVVMLFVCHREKQSRHRSMAFKRQVQSLTAAMSQFNSIDAHSSDSLLHTEVNHHYRFLDYGALNESKRPSRSTEEVPTTAERELTRSSSLSSLSPFVDMYLLEQGGTEIQSHEFTAGSENRVYTIDGRSLSFVRDRPVMGLLDGASDVLVEVEEADDPGDLPADCDC